MPVYEGSIGVKDMIIRNIFYGKLGASIFEDAVVLINTLKEADKYAETVNKLITDNEVFQLSAMLALKEKFPAIPMKYKGKKVKFVEIYAILMKARVELKVIVASLMMEHDIDVKSPELESLGAWGQPGA